MPSAGRFMTRMFGGQPGDAHATAGSTATCIERPPSPTPPTPALARTGWSCSAPAPGYACLFAANQCAKHKELVDMEGESRLVRMLATIKHRHNLRGASAEARLLLNLSHDVLSGRRARISPASRQSPLAFGALAHEQQSIVTKNDAAHVHLWSSVAGVSLQHASNNERPAKV